MGLAEPRKRIKISHDPRNLSWSTATNSYGQRLMQQQGWKAGEALGANAKGSKYSDAEAAKVNVKYKDDTLGLGASLKSKDIANQRTGFDAFQGLLGRLNAKTEDEVKAVERKIEDKKLAMFAQGRWGGMVFVPGGILVQSDPYKMVQALKAAKQDVADPAQDEEAEARTDQSKSEVEPTEDRDARAKRKAEKRQRREERRLKKEQKRSKKNARLEEAENEPTLPTPDSSSSDEDRSIEAKKTEKTKKRQTSDAPAAKDIKPEAETATATATQPKFRNGRHLLRGKNIQAKRMAFSDMKGLDQIFMKA